MDHFPVYSESEAVIANDDSKAATTNNRTDECLHVPPYSS